MCAQDNARVRRGEPSMFSAPLELPEFGDWLVWLRTTRWSRDVRGW